MEGKGLPPELQDPIRGFTGYCDIEIDQVEGGFCQAHIDLSEHHLNPFGTVHGGLLATLMDVATGTAAIYASEPKRLAVTQSCDLHYLHALTGKLALAEAQVLKTGRRTCFVHCEIYDAERRLCATGGFEYSYTEG